jgi:prepilin-type N-terminal cleavage/methylation domain-containing protein
MKKGFTLSEILITLVIIGIVAAISVPTLIQKYQDQALKSALKKNYSVLKSALDKYQIEHGERLLASDVQGIQLKSVLMKYLNVTKDYNLYNYFYTSNNNLYKTYNGKSNISWSLFDDGQFVLNDGTIIMIENPKSQYSNGSNRKYISVDVNGAKKPNRLGRDLFMFQLMDNGELLPMGAKGTYYYNEANEYCSNTSTDNMNGAGCSAKVLRD